MFAKKKATSSPTFTLAAGPWVESLACHISLKIGKMTLIFNIKPRTSKTSKVWSIAAYQRSTSSKVHQGFLCIHYFGLSPSAYLGGLTRHGGLQSCELRQRDGTPCALKICPKRVIWTESICAHSSRTPKWHAVRDALSLHIKTPLRPTMRGYWGHVFSPKIGDLQFKTEMVDPYLTLTLSQQGYREIHLFAI